MKNTSCPVCTGDTLEHFAHSRDVEYATGDRLYEYRRCAGCGSVMLVDPPAEELSRIYPQNYYSFAGPQKSLVERVKNMMDRRLFRRILKEVSGDSLRVLDAGGGSGWLLSQLRGCDARVRETHVVDIDTTAKAAVEEAGHTFHCSTIEEFQSSDTFHVILLLNLLEHVADPVELLRRLHGMLEPEGVLLIKTPNAKSLDARLFRKFYWGGLHCPRHFVLFTRASFLRAAKQCGLQCKCWYTQGAPQWTCSVLGSLVTKGRVQLSPERPLYKHPLYSPLLAVFAVFDLLRCKFSATDQIMAICTKRT